MVMRTNAAITTAIIHCAATPNGSKHSIKDIDQWHGPGREGQGKRPFQRRTVAVDKHQSHLKHVGYHYVIRTDGVLECGRSLEEVGAHAYKHNTHSVGICLIGTDQFTIPQWITLKSLILTLQQTIRGLKAIIGHYQVASHKPCPCFDVPAWIENGFNPSEQNILKA